MADYLLDSDVILWFLRGRGDAVALVKELSARGMLGCSALSLIEVLMGVRPKDELATEAFLGSLRAYPVDRPVATRAASLIRQYKTRGRTLQLADAAIAATCFAYDLTLVTYNRKDYPMPDLRLFP